MYIIMLGAPGTGKGTIGAEICKHYNLKHIATGDMFRDEIKRQTELGIKAQEYMGEGKLVPDEITIEMLKNRIKDLDGALLDGFPRTVPQAEALREYLGSKGERITTVVNLIVPDEDLIRRTSSRIVCPNKECGAAYNEVFMPPKVPGICDKCGAKLVKRPDDIPETIRQRIKVYYEETEPLIDFYNEENVVESVNINIYSPTTKEDTTAKAIAKINNHLQN